jgi:FtsP/CotA-like multicopper oxidase with cupredoxin domain
MLALLLALGCTSTEDTSSEVVDTPLPEIWGVEPAVDLDPAPGVVEFDIVAAPMEMNWLDGPTQVLAYNGQIPGPLLHARVGDLVRVNFTNEMDEASTIHWHGLRIDNAMDGTPAVMNPVMPGETFIYEFIVPEAGTFWYHPHMRTYFQLEMGLHGQFVVQEEENVNVAADRYFSLDDIRLDEDGSMSEFNYEQDSMMGRYGNMLLMNGQSDLPVAGEIESGTAERWRVVNTANARTMWVKIEGADWRVVGTDGGLLEETFTAKRLLLPVGQRYDIEVIPEPGAELVELIMQLPATDGGLWDDFPMYSAMVSGDSAEVPVVDWVPLVIPPMEEVVQEETLEFSVEIGALGNIKWMINGKTYDRADPINVFNVPTHLTVRDVSGMAHPFHLHGQFFQVITRNGEPVDIKESGLRDTVLIEGLDEVVLYTGFENLGSWMTHCHILEHAEAGMMVEMVVEDLGATD